MSYCGKNSMLSFLIIIILTKLLFVTICSKFGYNKCLKIWNFKIFKEQIIPATKIYVVVQWKLYFLYEYVFILVIVFLLTLILFQANILLHSTKEITVRISLYIFVARSSHLILQLVFWMQSRIMFYLSIQSVIPYNPSEIE